MARFILDVANLNNIKDFMNELFETDVISSNIATIHCIDETNDNQFYDNVKEGCNNLSLKQLNNYENILSENNQVVNSLGDMLLWNNHIMNYMVDISEDLGYLELTPIVLKLVEDLINNEYYMSLDASHSETVLRFLLEKGLITEDYYKRNV